MKRVLYISQGYSTHDRRFLDHLRRASCRVWFLPCAVDPNPLERRPLPEGVCALPPLKTRPGRTSIWQAGLAVLRLRRHLRKIGPDIVHAGPIQTGGFFAAAAGARPLVLMSWGSDVLVVPERSRWIRRITAWTLSKAQLIIADCEAVRKRILSLAPVRPDAVILLPFGVELDRFSGERGPKKPFWSGCKIVVSARSMEPGYGTDLLLEVARRVLQVRKDTRFLMLGDGSLKEEIETFIQKHDLVGLVHLPGRVPEGEIPVYFKGADLYVSTTRCDGTSISLLGAMASGLAVVVPDAYGNQEWVEPGTNGWRYPTGDAEALTAAILEALAGPQRCHRMGEANRALVSERANFSENFKRLLDGYERVMSTHV